MLLVREIPAPQHPVGSDFPAPRPRRSHRHAWSASCGSARTTSSTCRRGRRGRARDGALPGVHERYGPQPQASPLRAARRPRSMTSPTLLDAPSHDVDQMERDLRELVGMIQSPPSARPPRRHPRPGLRAVAALPRRAGGEVLPPGLPPRAPRTLPRRRLAVSATSATFPDASTARSRSPARCCTTSASSRPTLRRAGDPDVRRRQAPGRDPARLLPRAPGDRGPPRIPHLRWPRRSSTSSSPTTGRSSTAARWSPCTREATLVHMIDNLGGRLGSFDRLEKELPAGARWSGYDRALGGGAYFSKVA